MTPKCMIAERLSFPIQLVAAPTSLMQTSVGLGFEVALTSPYSVVNRSAIYVQTFNTAFITALWKRWMSVNSNATVRRTVRSTPYLCGVWLCNCQYHLKLSSHTFAFLSCLPYSVLLTLLLSDWLRLILLWYAFTSRRQGVVRLCKLFLSRVGLDAFSMAALITDIVPNIRKRCKVLEGSAHILKLLV